MTPSPFIVHRRVLAASLIGTAVEFYDFYVYAIAASLVFGPLFFPASSASAQLLLSYATFGLAFVARPLGASLFGHFGDRVGRKSTLVACLMLMGGSTLLIGFLPTWETAGWWAPVMLCILRFGQGLGLGGEWGGAALLAVENAPPGWRARFGMAPQLGAPVGFIAANATFLLLGLAIDPQDFLDWGWRLPFLGSAVLVGLGLWVRLRLTETPEYAAALIHERPPGVPLATVLRHHLGRTVAGTCGAIACFAVFYLATAFALGYGTTTLGYPRDTVLKLQLGAIFFMAFSVIAAGYLADRWDPRRVLMLGTIFTMATGLLLAPMLEEGSLGLIFAWLVLALTTMGFVYGPIGAWLPSLFPPTVRYTGASIGFNVGSILGGALTPLIAQALADRGWLEGVGLYLAGAGLVSLIALVSLKSAPAASTT